MFGKNNGSFFGSLLKGALIVGATVLISSPKARKKIGDLAAAGIRASLKAVDVINSELARTREDIEDIVAEAKVHAAKEKVKEMVGITKE